MNDGRLTHVDETGAARMVDVSAKDVTARTARASGRVRLSDAAVAALRGGGVPKGDAIAVARIAGIAGSKRTPDLIPLCHPIALHGVTVDLATEDWGVSIVATARTADRTGVEMEALTAVSVAALALVDMVKAIDPAAVISDIQVEEKTGGESGPWRRPVSDPEAGHVRIRSRVRLVSGSGTCERVRSGRGCPSWRVSGSSRAAACGPVSSCRGRVS